MAKKTTAAKTTAKVKRSAKPQVDQHPAKSNRSKASHPDVDTAEVERDEIADRGAPIEHFRGERNRGQQTGDAGSLDEETLDRDAPYNRTYGQRSEG
jgi:hypothetical protein